MKPFNRRLLVSAITTLMLAFCSLRSEAAIADSITVFDPQGNVFQSPFGEAFVSVDTETGDIVSLNIPNLTDPLQEGPGHATALTDNKGNLTDVFGVINGELAFASGPIQSPGSVLSVVAVIIPQDSGLFSATMYLSPDLRAEGYTAQFFSAPSSVPSVPDGGATSALLGLSVSGLVLLRGKLSSN